MLLEVKVKKINFSDIKTDYKIFKGQIMKMDLRDDEKHLEFAIQKTMTFKGIAISCREGDTYTINANLKSEPNGVVLYINSCIVKKIELEEELEKYLIHHIKGVGKSTAKKIMDTLGVGAIDTIKSENGVEELCKIIKNKEKAVTIREHIIANENIFNIMNYLQINNLDVKIANKILKEYGNEGLLNLEGDPYFFIRAIDFKTLDKIASKKNLIKSKDIRRISAGIVAIVDNKTKFNGDVYTHIDTIYDELEDFINNNASLEPIKLNYDEIHKALKYIQETEKLTIENGKYLYKKYLRNKENDIAFHISRLNKVDRNFSTNEIMNHIAEYEKANRVVASEEQKEAVVKALQNNFSILTGLPGAGKTFTINLILKIYEKLNKDNVVKLIAPTGKASKRMEELTGRQAETIHRALKLVEDFSDGEELNADFVIIDEASMIDIYLAGTLLQNINSKTKVLIVGDVEQLPSVGAGLILRDFIDSGVIPTTRLTKLFRQGANSNIVKNSHCIVNNSLDFEWKKDAIFWESQDVADIEHKIISGYKRLLELGYSRLEIGILCPQKSGDIGTYRINKLIQEKFNKGAKELVINKQGDKIKEKDLVMHNVNNYDLEVFNGEIGLVEKIETVINPNTLKPLLNKEGDPTHIIYVRYADKDDVVAYTEEFFEQLELAYCITIHKSQGSEYRAVMNITSKVHNYMLNKNLIYTAWTRAKEFLVVIGDMETLKEAITKKEQVSRLSNLSERLEGVKFSKHTDIYKKVEDKTIYKDIINGKEYTYTLDELI